MEKNHGKKQGSPPFTLRIHHQGSPPPGHQHSPPSAAPDLAQQQQLAKPRGAASAVRQLALQQQSEVLRGQNLVVHGELLGLQGGGLGGFGWVVLVVSCTVSWLVGG